MSNLDPILVGRIAELKTTTQAMVQSNGYGAALTHLHQEIQKLEKEAFDGRAGWQPDLWEALPELRELGRDLWEKSIQESPTSASPGIRQFK